MLILSHQPVRCADVCKAPYAKRKKTPVYQVLPRPLEGICGSVGSRKQGMQYEKLSALKLRPSLMLRRDLLACELFYGFFGPGFRRISTISHWKHLQEDGKR